MSDNLQHPSVWQICNLKCLTTYNIQVYDNFKLQESDKFNVLNKHRSTPPYYCSFFFLWKNLSFPFRNLPGVQANSVLRIMWRRFFQTSLSCPWRDKIPCRAKVLFGPAGLDEKYFDELDYYINSTLLKNYNQRCAHHLFYVPLLLFLFWLHWLSIV